MRLTPEKIKIWWLEQSDADAEATLKKLVQYGSLDFHAHAIEALMGKRNAPLGQLTEAVLGSYVAGKTGRIMESLSIGGQSHDHWHDITCYSLMARYVRQYGSWP